MIRMNALYLLLPCAIFVLIVTPSSSCGEVYGVTCFDGSHHPPGFDCSSLIPKDKATDDPVSLPSTGRQNPNQLRIKRRQEEKLRIQKDKARRRELRELEEEQARLREEALKREALQKMQFEKDKQNALKLLKSTDRQLDTKSTFGSGLKIKSTSESKLKLKGVQEPLFSIGNKHSAPVDLQDASSTTPKLLAPERDKSIVGQKGLRTNYVPKPALPSLEDYHYDKKSKNEIVFDALEIGSGDIMVSIEHLERYLLEVDSKNVKVQEALSYVQGMAEGSYVVKEKENEDNKEIVDEKAANRRLFDPGQEDSYHLLDAVARPPGIRKWPGPKRNSELAPSLVNPLDWRSVRDSAIAETVKELHGEWDSLNRDDLKNCIQNIEKLQQENPNSVGYSQAIEFFKGVMTHYEQ